MFKDLTNELGVLFRMWAETVSGKQDLTDKELIELYVEYNDYLDGIEQRDVGV